MSNITAIHSAFSSFVKATADARKQLIDALRAAGVTTVEEARPHTITWASKQYACPLVEGSRKANGRMVLDRDHKNYEAARKAAQVLQRAIEAGTVKREERAVQQVVVTRAERAAAMAFLSTFEGATLAEQIRAAKRVLAALA